MAEALGADLHPPADCGAQDVPDDGELGAHGTCHTSVAEPSRTCGRDGAPEEAAGTGRPHGQSGNLRAPRVQEVRQHPRKFQPMQEMSAGVQIGSTPRRLAAPWRSAVASFFALATALIFQHPDHHQGHDQRKGQGQDFTTRTTTSKARAKARPVILPITEADPTLEEIWDPAAFPPDSDGREDGYPSWEMD